MSLVKKYKKCLFAVLIVLFFVLACVGIIHFHRNYFFQDVNLVIEDTLAGGEGKTAKVILLGGQSNASGCSRNDYLKKKDRVMAIGALCTIGVLFVICTLASLSPTFTVYMLTSLGICALYASFPSLMYLSIS